MTGSNLLEKKTAKKIDRASALALMKRDEDNLELADGDGRERMQVYFFGEPSITAGRNIRISNEQIDEWNSKGYAFAKRPTGGGILRHQFDLCFGIVFPFPNKFPGELFTLVADATAYSLAKLGIATAIPHSKETTAPRFCFEKAVGPELTFQGKKILGLAARKKKNATLIQGTLAVKSEPNADADVSIEGPKIDLSQTKFDESIFVEEFLKKVREEMIELAL
ncbi:MAG: hypothetical protein JKX97_02160 [Candidatus Lindowbacteria bacterium]|nr:hypothetical protein [Candidatus Lindowbacteria bacterium]